MALAKRAGEAGGRPTKQKLSDAVGATAEVAVWLSAIPHRFGEQDQAELRSSRSRQLQSGVACSRKGPKH